MNTKKKIEISLAELPAGSLFKVGDTIALKTEYREDNGAIDAYIVGSGEMFWGGTSTAEDQAMVKVIPLPDIEELITLWRDIDLILTFKDCTDRRRLSDIEQKILSFNEKIN